jgi:hypothetical protein
MQSDITRAFRPQPLQEVLGLGAAGVAIQSFDPFIANARTDQDGVSWRTNPPSPGDWAPPGSGGTLALADGLALLRGPPPSRPVDVQ